MARPVALAALAVALAACVSTPPPEPVGRAQLGGSYRQIGVAPRPLLATCGGDAMAGETRAAVSSWLDVLRHTDGCNLSQVRYYAADATVSPLRQRLGLLAMRGDSCGAEAMRLDGRVADLQTRLTRLAATTGKGRSSAKIVEPLLITTARSTALESSRTLPGQA